MKKGPVLVCVTAQSSCEALIEKGRITAEKLGTALETVSVQSVDMTAEERAAVLNTLYSISKKASADIVVYYNDDPAQTAAQHARRTHACHIVTGKPCGGAFVRDLRLLLPDVPISSADENYIPPRTAHGFVRRHTAAGM